MQRTGRKGHATFRVVVQDSRVTPTSGKVVAYLGSYDPHAKTTTVDKEKAVAFLKNGAQPSDRVALMLKSEGVKLPEWVSVDAKKAGKLRNPEKLRKNQPKDAPKAKVEDAPQAEPVATEEAAETPESGTEEVASDETATDQSSEVLAKGEEPTPEAETETKEEA
jgi:small subunit ribosomal protein S16